MSRADHLANLTLDDYAREAFSLKSDRGTRYRPDGGVYAGSASPLANPTSRDRKPFAPRARLVTVPVGRVFARWVSSAMLTRGWAAAAAGAWWTTDTGVEEIIANTTRTHGANGDSGAAARVFSNVGYFQNDGNAWSDMRCVVACRIEHPVKILLGVGRPTSSNRPTQNGSRDKQLWDSREVQAVMFTTWKGTFRGQEFLAPVFFGSSSDFTRWWSNESPFRKRRAATGGPVGREFR
jgi:hypothetical protein